MSDDDSATSSDDLSEESTSWVSWFCSLRGNEFFCVVEEEYIADGFNLSGLKEDVQHYDMAMETIVDAEQADNHNLNEVLQEEVDSAAELLYGLIHARFILTSKGLTLMVSAHRSAACYFFLRGVVVFNALPIFCMLSLLCMPTFYFFPPPTLPLLPTHPPTLPQIE
jgi:hypothetical protein